MTICFIISIIIISIIHFLSLELFFHLLVHKFFKLNILASLCIAYFSVVLVSSLSFAYRKTRKSLLLKVTVLTESSEYIHFHRDLSAPEISTDMSQVGVALFPLY